MWQVARDNFMELNHSESFKLYHAFMYSFSVTSHILPEYCGLKGFDSCFKFSRFMAHISAQIAAIVTEEFLVFPQSFKAGALRVTQTGPQMLQCTTF
jgi:hypothetical protein